MLPIHITILYAVAGALMIFVGILAAFSKFNKSANKILVAFIFSVCAWMFTLYKGFLLAPINIEIANWHIRWAHSFGISAYAFLSIFFFLFPKSLSRDYPNWIKLVYLLITATLFILSATTPLIYKSGIVKNELLSADILGPLYLAFIFYILLSYILTILFTVRQFQLSRGININQLIIASIGGGLSLMPIFLVNVLLPLFGIYILQLESPAFFGAFIFTAFYAIHQYRFLKASDTILKIIRMTLLVSTFIGSNIFSYLFLTNILEQRPVLIGLISISTVALLITYLLSKHLPEFISEDLRSFKKIMHNFSYELYGCTTYADLQKIIEQTFLIELNLQSANIYLISQKSIKGNIPIYAKTKLVRALLHVKDVLVKSELQAQGKPEYKTVINEMMELDAEICMPLRRDGNIIGFLSLGTKNNTRLFSREEIGILHLLEEGLVVSFTNILLKSDLQYEVDSLRKIVEQKTKRIKKQTKDLRELNKKQEEFISISSHELRSPLTVALAQSDMLLRKKEFDLPGMQMIHDSLDKMNHLIQTLFDTQLFDLSKIEPRLTSVMAKQYFTDVCEENNFLLRQRDLTIRHNFDISSNTTVEIDTTLIRQVMQNLMANAVKFSPQYGQVHISIREESNTIHICIADSGPGIPKKDLDSIFKKYWGGKRDKHAEQGVGLGLYISQKIVELHGGSIWAENVPKGGARFCIRLPKA